MKIEIITPDKTIFAGKGKLIQLPGLDGLFAVLQNHAPLIASLKAGKVKIIDHSDVAAFYDITSGVVEVKENQVLVLVG